MLKTLHKQVTLHALRAILCRPRASLSTIKIQYQNGSCELQLLWKVLLYCVESLWRKCNMPRYLGCALTHFVFGSLFFLLGIIDLRAVNNGDRIDWSDSVRYFVIFYGVWVGSYFFLCCERKQNKVTHFSTYKVEKSLWPFARVCKTRQDNALFGVLYSPMYIDFIQII